tara:strand:+ start:444 stop:722 length:279 start_codon:yes stop_codon:yes gene_type:complete
MGYDTHYYVNDAIKPYYEQLRLISKCNKTPLNGEITKAIKHYIEYLNGEPVILGTQKERYDFIQNASEESLLKMSDQIHLLNERIIGKLKWR